MRKRCKHDWSKWTNPFTVEYTRDSGHFGETSQAKRRIQTRTCAECNMVESRIVHYGTPKD